MTKNWRDDDPETSKKAGGTNAQRETAKIALLRTFVEPLRRYRSGEVDFAHGGLNVKEAMELADFGIEKPQDVIERCLIHWYPDDPPSKRRDVARSIEAQLTTVHLLNHREGFRRRFSDLVTEGLIVPLQINGVVIERPGWDGKHTQQVCGITDKGLDLLGV